jgi:hypothetical protein
MVHSQPYSTKGTRKYVEFELTSPIPVDASVNLWVVFHNTNGDWVAPICENTGDKNGRWMSTDGVNWADIGTTNMSGTFMVRAFVESMRGERALGERNEDATFSHYNVYRGTSLDDMEVIAKPTAGYYFDEVEKVLTITKLLQHTSKATSNVSQTSLSHSSNQKITTSLLT